MNQPRIALVTSREYADLSADDRIFARLLEERARVEMAVWNDVSVDWRDFDLCVIRSTWDFHLRAEDFGRWLDRVEKETECLNAPHLVRWNLHKGYLLELQRRHIPIVPTHLLRAGEPHDVGAIARANGWSMLVLKPAISASSYRTKTFDAAGFDAQTFAGALLRDGDALLQPFVNDVLEGGERSYVVIGADITHVVRRAPFNGGASGAPQPAVARRPDEVALVRAVLGALPAEPAYARVDVVRLQTGQPVVAEVELIEPSLFFLQGPHAAAALCAIVVPLAERRAAERERKLV